MSETAIVKGNVFQVLQSKIFLEKLSNSIPNQLDPKRAVQLAITLIKGSKSLSACTPISLMACVVESATLGLELDKLLGHVYMVPFRAKNGTVEAQLIVGYRGFAHLMYQSGMVASISAEVVRPGDKFQIVLGTDRRLIHVPKFPPLKNDHENWRGAYAVASFITGKNEFEYMDREHIEAIRARSQSWRAWKKEKRETPWITDGEEMWRKTPLRRLSKRMPVSTTDKRELLLRAVMLDEYGERKGLLLPTERGFEVNENYEPEPNGNEEPLAPTTELVPQSVPEKDASGTKPPAPAQPDPQLTIGQQTTIYHTASQSGWKIPEEVTEFVKKHFKVASVTQVRNSQFVELLEKVKSGS